MTSTSETVSISRRFVWVAIWSIPALLTGGLAWVYGVDTPHWDQWRGLCPLFIEAEAGTLDISDFLARHNEHVILFPRLLMYSLARLTQWNVRAELLVIWLLGCVCILGLFRLAAATGHSAYKHRWQYLAISALAITPLGWENWLWGFQIALLLPAASVIVALCTATSLRYPLSLVITAILCTVCTFSIGGGFLYWLLFFPQFVAASKRRESRARAIWLVLTALGFGVGLYISLAGERDNAPAPGSEAASANFFDMCLHAIVVLGGLFAHAVPALAPVLSGLVGAVLLALLAFVILQLWQVRTEDEIITRAMPWISFAAFGLLNAGLIAIARTRNGLIDGALPSRYAPFAMALPIALLFLVPLVLGSQQATGKALPRRRGMQLMATMIIGVLVIAHLIGVVRSLENWRMTHHARLFSKSLVRVSSVINDSELMKAKIHVFPERMKERFEVLDRLGYIRPARLASNAISAFADVPPAMTSEYGEFSAATVMPNYTLRLSGWAVLPAKRRIADAVLITFDDQGGDPRIFAIAETGIELPKGMGNPDLSASRFSGWAKIIDLVQLPAGAKNLRAWSYDAELGHAYGLLGSVPELPN